MLLLNPQMIYQGVTHGAQLDPVNIRLSPAPKIWKPNRTIRRSPLKRISGASTAAKLLLQHALMLRENPCRDSVQHIRAGVDWLISAQDGTEDAGVSKGFALNKGWLPSYVETTGYIIPTMFDCSELLAWPDCRRRALKMAEWELSSQLADGSFPGCPIETAERPLVFDTGMVLFGLIRGYEETGDDKFRTAAQRAGNWLLSFQEDSGQWETHTLNDQPRAYHTRVAWALLQLSDITKDAKYRQAALKNLQWSVKQQLPNGWFRNNSFYGEDSALTHTIAYAARGLLESGIITQEATYIDAAQLTARALRDVQRPDGSLSGSFGKDWRDTSRFTCLSGNAQAAIIWLRLFELTGDVQFLEAANRSVAFLKKMQNTSTNHGAIRGGMKSTHPIFRGYIKLFYSSWAVKFFIDLLLLHMNYSSES